jgi:hypothetical protein
LEIDRSPFHVQLIDHEKDQHSSHAIETETFPHFTEKQGPNLLGIFALKILNVRDGHCAGAIRIGLVHWFQKSLW